MREFLYFKNRCLSVDAPFAQLLVGSPGCDKLGIKDVENRPVSLSYTGPILIHCTKKTVPILSEYYIEDDAIKNGGFVGIVTMTGCLDSLDSVRPSWWAEPNSKFWWLFTGRRCALPFVPFSGKQGLWNVTNKELLATARLQSDSCYRAWRENLEWVYESKK